MERDSTFNKAEGLGRVPAQPGEGTGMCPMSRTFFATDQFGHAVPSQQHVLSLGRSGPVLLHDFQYLNMQTAFDRERIPERNVHAKGHGAHGVFKVTDNSISRYTKAKCFAEGGKETPVFVRMSAVNFERGFADSQRDPRGFAIKFYCQDPGEGIMDWIFLNTPVFFIRDPMKAPSTIHVCKRNPQSNLRREQDPKAMDMFWDFMTLNPETLHTVMWLYGDRGLPMSYRHMQGYSVHSFKTRNAEGEAFFMKIHLKSRQGVRNFEDPAEAKRVAGVDPDFYGHDLFDSIERGEYPKWDAYYQVMTLDQARGFMDKYGYNPFEITKVWYHQDFPLHKFGELELNRNVLNYESEVEHAAFLPGNLCPGFEVNPHDKLFCARTFYYRDTQTHRLGGNYHLIPVNNGSVNGPDKAIMANAIFARDGQVQASSNWGNALSYAPTSSDKSPIGADILGARHVVDEQKELLLMDEDAKAGRPVREDYYGPKTGFQWVMMYGTENADDVDFIQPGLMWSKAFDEGQRQRWIKNVAADLKSVTQESILQRALNMFNHANPDCGMRLATELGVKIRPSGLSETPRPTKTMCE